MIDVSQFTLREVLLVAGICAAASLAGAIALLVIATRQIADIEIPPDADFFETLQLLPITVPLALDLLDGAFDVFSAPISWIILELLGLRQLQMVTVFEGVIPGTQLIPTMTGAWVISRIMKNRQPQSEVRDNLKEYDLQERLRRRNLGRNANLSEGYRRRALPGPDDSFDVVDGEAYRDREDYDFEIIEEEEFDDFSLDDSEF